MSKSKPRTLSIGVISEGTLRPEDIFSALEWDLRHIRMRRNDRRTVQRLSRFFWSLPEGCMTGDDTETLDELYNVAEEYLPDYTYLGAVEGDGACIGVWPIRELLDDPTFDGFVASDRGEAKQDQTHAIEVNDHGNATLWRRSGPGRRWIEVWSVV